MSIVITLLVMFSLVVITFLSIPHSYYEMFKSQPAQVHHSGRQDGKTFLYLAQVEECLKPYHLQKDVLGSGYTHDVLVLSYRKRCQHNSYDHIEYVEAGRKTTWTSGRNFLYNYVKDNWYYQIYQYYIFMDQDVQLVNNNVIDNFGLECNEVFRNLSLSPESPWRKFENFLLFYEPAIGEVDHEVHYRLLFNKSFSNAPAVVPAYLSGFLFDGMFNAFHQDVVDHLLPYDETFDSQSWWVSQELMQCKVFFRYHAQMIMFLPIVAINDEHSKYPAGLREPKKICSDEGGKAPLHIRNAMAALKISKLTNLRRATLFSYIAPPKTVKEEYKFFDESFPVLKSATDPSLKI